MKVMKKVKSNFRIIIKGVLIVVVILFVEKPFFIPKVIQRVKLVNEVSFEYAMLLDRLDKLQIEYSREPSIEIEEKIKETECLLQEKYPDQIGPSDIKN